MKLNFKWLKSGDGLFRLVALVYAGLCLAISAAVMGQNRSLCIPIQKNTIKMQAAIKKLDSKIGAYTIKNIEGPNSASVVSRAGMEYNIFIPVEGAFIYLLILAFMGLLAICVIISIVNYFMKLCTCVNLTGAFWWFDVIFHLAGGLIMYLFTVVLFIKLVRSEEGSGTLTSECASWHEVKGNTTAETKWRNAPGRNLFKGNKQPLICLTEFGHYLRMLDGLLGIFIGVLYLAICVGLVVNKLKEIAEIEKSQMAELEQEKKVWIEEKEATADKVKEKSPPPEKKLSPKASIVPKLSDEKKLSQSSEKKLSEPSEKKLSESSPSEKKLSQSSEKKLSQSSEKKLSEPSEKKLSTSSDGKKSILPKPSEQKIEKSPDENVEKIPEEKIAKAPKKKRGRRRTDPPGGDRKSTVVSFAGSPTPAPAPVPGQAPTPSPSQRPLAPPAPKKEDPIGGIGRHCCIT